MISSEKKGVSLVEASSWERPFLQEDLAGQNKDSSTIDPDLLPMMNGKPEVEQQKNWKQADGAWTRSTEQDPDILADPPVQDPDILADIPVKEK